MTSMNVRKLVREHKPQVVEILRLKSGDLVDVASEAYKQVESLVVEDFEVYHSKLTGKTHLRVIPKI